MSRRRGPIRNAAEELAVEVAVSALSRLSDEAADRFGAFLGRLFRHGSRRRRELAERNLARAFPEKDAAAIERLSRLVFEHFGRLSVDLVRTIDEPLESIVARVTIVNAELARQAAASGRGVFFLTAHLGNWELGALLTAHLGLPMGVVVRPLDNPRLDRRMRAFREQTGNVVIPKADAARPILRALRAGGAIGILIDQHAHPPDAVVVPFFGRPAATTSAVARLADRTEALIMPVTMTRIEGLRYQLLFEEPIDVRRLPRQERAVEPLTRRLNEELELRIQRTPEQWLWLHDRWRV